MLRCPIIIEKLASLELMALKYNCTSARITMLSYNGSLQTMLRSPIIIEKLASLEIELDLFSEMQYASCRLKAFSSAQYFVVITIDEITYLR